MEKVKKTNTEQNKTQDKEIDNPLVKTRICQRCKRMFTYSGFGHLYCDICKKSDERDFEKVRDYIISHPGATMLEVSDETGVYMKYIEMFLKEGRLEIPENSPIFIKCEICNKDIRFGRVCGDCADKLTQKKRDEMNFDEYQVGESPKTKKVGKMRFVDRKKER